MARQTAKAKRPPAVKVTAGDPHGLRPDGGWGDAVRAELAGANAGERAFLDALLGHFAAAKPRKPFADFSEAQRKVDENCFMEPMDDYEDDEPPLVDEPGFEFVTYAPGSEQYAKALWQAAPDEKWFATFDELAKRLKRDRVAAAASRWVAAAARSKPGLLNRPGPNRWLLHAAIFACMRLGTARCADALRQMAVSACDNRTAQGPTCAAALALIGTPEALGALHLLTERARTPAHRARFGRAAQHLQAVTGLTADDAAERFTPTFDLAEGGTRTFAAGGCTAELRVDPLGSVEVQWRDANGKPCKTAPAAARKDGAATIAELKAIAKSIEKMLAAQRDRLDRLIGVADRKSWRLGEWRAWYVDHPIVGVHARRLIWLVDDAPALFPATGEPPQDVKGNVVKATASGEVRPWHPATRPAKEVLAWRQRLAKLGVTQPFKQAHREVYLLTDAERRTRTYSNRFAAHVIRQHQFRQLASQRGWDTKLKMIHDGAADSVASKSLRQHGLRGEFWTNGAGEDQTTAAGAYLYLTTDQVRFYRDTEREPLPLEQIPPLAFSEVMRDIDLFVGVASVGNDPTWQDGGPGGRYRDYWQGASFGELGETAKTRRAVLETLVPRLKIAARCKLADRFLVVRGQLRTYKIHLGSGNILMQPNDQYLCIVPDQARPSDASAAADVFLPFEGDRTLSVILSKAFLLADDAAITDATITRQIKKR